MAIIAEHGYEHFPLLCVLWGREGNDNIMNTVEVKKSILGIWLTAWGFNGG